MTTRSSPPAPPQERVEAGYLAAWTVGDLPEAPLGGWRTWLKLVGPGVLLAGASIGSGEWLFGPGVTAQYGATLLWLASLSIIGQVFANLQMMRYAAYCGESIVVGYLRTWPGPRFWMFWYALLDTAAIWPFNASNAAVPLAAAMLGHLPGDATVTWLNWTFTETQLVRALGYVVFLAAFVPLVFGGTIYKTLERVMRIKLVLVLVYLITFVALMVSPANMLEVVTGFFRIGTVPLRAESVVAGRHFTLSRDFGEHSLTVKGTVENGQPFVITWVVRDGQESRTYSEASAVPELLRPEFAQLIAEAGQLARRGEFYIADQTDQQTLTIRGSIGEDGSWVPAAIAITDEHARTQHFASLRELPVPLAALATQLVENQGIERVGLVSYWSTHHRLPSLDWAMLAAFAAIAGAGGLTNTLFSNFVRDAGWGMGAKVGAIPSAFGGRHIQLSHVGEVFRLDANNRRRWRGWMRHIRRDQIGVWMLCSFLGMALPCMLSLEFIRHAPVAGNRVAALMADGMAERYPDHRALLWGATLLCGFLVLAPGQILSGDQIARRWTDIIWTANARVRKLSGEKVKWIYYVILTLYGLWGMVALALFNPLQIAQISAVLMNFALGWSALHSVYVNCMFLPKELRPAWWMHAGAICCGVFFIAISGIVLWYF